MKPRRDGPAALAPARQIAIQGAFVIAIMHADRSRDGNGRFGAATDRGRIIAA
jgi:hypothetical protein